MTEGAKQLIEVLERVMLKAANDGNREALDELSKIYQRVKSVNQ